MIGTSWEWGLGGKNKGEILSYIPYQQNQKGKRHMSPTKHTDMTCQEPGYGGMRVGTWTMSVGDVPETEASTPLTHH